MDGKNCLGSPLGSLQSCDWFRWGRNTEETAQLLGLGEEGVTCSHIKKAQSKLGVRNRTHAACEAIRQNLIP